MGVAAGVLGVLLSVAAGNVQSVPPLAATEVRHDTRALFSLQASVVCGNEIAPASYRATWRRVARRAGYRTPGPGTDNPVAVAHGLQVLRVRVRHLSPGVAGMTPDRTATVVLIGAPGGRVVVVCTHLVSRAWTHQEATTAWRRHLWREAARRLRAIVRAWRTRGVSVVVAGDVNRPTRVRWCPRQRPLANLDLIQVAACPAPGWRTSRGRSRDVRDVYTDHPLLRRVVRLEPIASGP